VSELPQGWTQVPLSSIAVDATQRVPLDAEAIRYIDIGSVNRNTKSIESPQELLGKDAPSRARKLVAVGDTLVSMTRPNLNAVALVPKELDGQIASTGFDVLRPIAGIDPRWIGYLVRTDSFVEAMSDLVQGALYPAVRSKDVRAHVVPLAPEAEQTRIANQLDTLLARVQACNDRFDAIPALLKRFRQTILDAATTGQLTDDWRKDNLGQVTAEEVVTARLAAAGARPTKAATAFFANHRPAVPEKGVLPDSWLLTHIGMVGAVSNGSTPSRQEPLYWGSGIPWVSSGEVANGVIRHTREQITNEGFKNTSVRLLPRGTVLMAMIGEGKTRGQSAILDIDACINQNVAGVVPVDGILDSKYLWFWFRREYQNTRTKGNGSGPKALNCERVRELEINLPPIAEQAEIVRLVEALFALTDRIETRCADAQAQAQRLTPLVLAKAFRGELVPQDPNDEPASMLLERIVPSSTVVAGSNRREVPATVKKIAQTSGHL
jgi:type I restriction enzyme, S subunit